MEKIRNNSNIGELLLSYISNEIRYLISDKRLEHLLLQSKQTSQDKQKLNKERILFISQKVIDIIRLSYVFFKNSLKKIDVDKNVKEDIKTLNNIFVEYFKEDIKITNKNVYAQNKDDIFILKLFDIILNPTNLNKNTIKNNDIIKQLMYKVKNNLYIKNKMELFCLIIANYIMQSVYFSKMKQDYLEEIQNNIKNYKNKQQNSFIFNNQEQKFDEKNQIAVALGSYQKESLKRLNVIKDNYNGDLGNIYVPGIRYNVTKSEIEDKTLLANISYICEMVEKNTNEILSLISKCFINKNKTQENVKELSNALCKTNIIEVLNEIKKQNNNSKVIDNIIAFIKQKNCESFTVQKFIEDQMNKKNNQIIIDIISNIFGYYGFSYEAFLGLKLYIGKGLNIKDINIIRKSDNITYEQFIKNKKFTKQHIILFNNTDISKASNTSYPRATTSANVNSIEDFFGKKCRNKIAIISDRFNADRQLEMFNKVVNDTNEQQNQKKQSNNLYTTVLLSDPYSEKELSGINEEKLNNDRINRITDNVAKTMNSFYRTYFENGCSKYIIYNKCKNTLLSNNKNITKTQNYLSNNTVINNKKLTYNKFKSLPLTKQIDKLLGEQLPNNKINNKTSLLLEMEFDKLKREKEKIVNICNNTKELHKNIKNNNMVLVKNHFNKLEELIKNTKSKFDTLYKTNK